MALLDELLRTTRALDGAGVEHALVERLRELLSLCEALGSARGAGG